MNEETTSYRRRLHPFEGVRLERIAEGHMAKGERLDRLGSRLEGIGSTWSRKKLLTIRTVLLSLVAILSTLGAIGLEHLHQSSNGNGVAVALQLNGQSEITEAQLRKLVIENHLQVFWAGPEQGSRYLLSSMDRTAIVLTILPPINTGRSTRATYPEITTYVEKDAFTAVLNGKQSQGGGGFLNSDGNSVFFSESDPKNVYVGLRGLDIEIQIYDPTPGRSLAIAKGVGTLRPIS